MIINTTQVTILLQIAVDSLAISDSDGIFKFNHETRKEIVDQINGQQSAQPAGTNNVDPMA